MGFVMGDVDTAAKTAAEVAKLELEAEKLRQEIAAGDVELEMSRLQLEVEQATARADRMFQRKLAAKYRREWRAEQRREYVFDIGVTGSSVAAAIGMLQEWHETDPTCDITITFNSPGGSVFDGLRLADFIEFLGETHHVTTKVSGIAASMAGALLQYGTYRVIGRNSFLHLHEVATGSLGKASDLLDTARLAERLTEKIAAQYAERSGGRHTAESVHDMMRRHEVYLSADEALEHGFVDAIE